jgi:GNAT superfamily N-acetyltransferase
MYMVWPITRLPSAPEVVLPAEYSLHTCQEADLNTVRALLDADEPVPDTAWEAFRDCILPDGAFLIVLRDSGQPVVTASAAHNPRATRYYFPFGGEVGYVTVDPAHRRRGLGRAVVARVVARLISGGYRHIFVGVQGWRLPAVRCYFSLGFVPLLHDESLLPRWQGVCEQIGWASREAEWPKSLVGEAGGRA